jgi:hypothetical protein
VKFRLRAPSPALVISLIALFVALGGTTYAATSLPRNSVGTAQLRNGGVTRKKLNKKTILALKGARGPQGLQGPKGDTGASGFARAYGQVIVESGSFALVAGTTKGVVDLTPGAGGSSAACIHLDPSIDASTATVIATPNDRSGSSANWDNTAFEDRPLGYCSGANVIEVDTSVFSSPGKQVKSAFSFLVP